MYLKHSNPGNLREKVLSIFGKYLDLAKYQVFFFGSRVKGTHMERSDIDIGIDGPNEIPPAVKFKLEEELEKLPTLYKIEMVDFKKVSPSFKKEALQSIEMLN